MIANNKINNNNNEIIIILSSNTATTNNNSNDNNNNFFSYLERIISFQFFCFVFQIEMSIVNWTIHLCENYQIIWEETVKNSSLYDWKFFQKKVFRFLPATWNFSSTLICIDGKHNQLQFLLISEYMILVEGVSDCLMMERGSSSATYVAGRKLLSEHWQLFSSRVRTLNIS